MGRASRLSATHEAAHAVARVYVGGLPTAVEIDVNGGGLSHAPNEMWACGSRDQFAAWDYLVVMLAGGYAEARAAKRAATTVFSTTASEDMAQALSVIEWLVQQRFAVDSQEAWRRAEDETKRFLNLRWTEIDTVAAALLEHSKLDAKAIEAMTNRVPYE